MSTCKYDRTAEDYLTDDGRPCRHDDYGDPTQHCTARRTCAQHVGAGELTCARCVGRTRAKIKRIPALVALMPAAAVEAGVNSEAANLAGLHANPAGWQDRRIAMRAHLAHWERAGRISEQQHIAARMGMEDDDDLDPYLLLGRWDLELREAYNQPSDTPVTITNAAAYLDANLGRIAQDPEQDFPLLARQVKACFDYIEAQLDILRRQQRGIPCPECTSPTSGVGPRLVLHFGHWCEDVDCEKIHFADDSGDRWLCPRNRAHEWTPKDYSERLEDRRAS